MADIVRTTARISITQPKWAEIFDFMFDPATPVALGQPVYITSAGNAAPADANGSGTTQAKGVVVNIQGRCCSVCRKGHVAGYAISGLAYDAKAYLSNTVGELSDAAGAIAAPVGTVVPAPDDSRTKLLYVDFPWVAVQA